MIRSRLITKRFELTIQDKEDFKESPKYPSFIMIIGLIIVNDIGR